MEKIFGNSYLVSNNWGKEMSDSVFLVACLHVN
jgi:hypothetical protein